MMKTASSACLLALTLCAPAQATLLNFDGLSGCSADWEGTGPAMNCDSGGAVLQGLGDQAGLHIEYRDVGQGNNLSLLWWADGYNDLPSALYAGTDDASSHAQITLWALPGYEVKLNGFALGAWQNNSLGTQVSVMEVGGAQTLLQGPVTAGNLDTNTATTLSFGGAASVHGWVIEWQNSAYSVGLNQLDFEVSAVPEPQAWWLMLAGLGALAWRRRPR